jgi:hypothetical protein
MRAAVQRRLVKSPALLVGPEGAFELVLDVEHPTPIEHATIKIGMWMRKKGRTPTNQGWVTR